MPRVWVEYRDLRAEGELDSDDWRVIKTNPVTGEGDVIGVALDKESILALFQALVIAGEHNLLARTSVQMVRDISTPA